MKHIKRIFAVVLTACALSAAAKEPELVASKEPGWPQWRGPRRDGVSNEKGLLATWPEGGPKLLWKSSVIGKGHSSPIISRGSIYITGDEGTNLCVFALDLEGKVKWKAPNGAGWKRNFEGSRSSCCISDGYLYHMNANGRVACLKAIDGTEVWSVSILEKYVSQNILWGLSESPLVVDGKVYVTPAGQEALMVALDAKTGQQLWKTDALEGEKPTYASAIMVDTDKGRQVIACGSANTFGVDAATGTLLWKHKHEIDCSVALTPSYYKNNVIVSLCIRSNACYTALSLNKEGTQVERKWKHEMGNPFGGVTCAEGKVICSSQRNAIGWFCLDAETGTIQSKQEKTDSGSSIYADGKVYGLYSNGKMALIEASANDFRVISEFELIKGKKDVWAHPVICDGRLYLRYADTLYCYDVKK
jgi:outer membrane protein assembly factor BamB